MTNSDAERLSGPPRKEVLAYEPVSAMKPPPRWVVVVMAIYLLCVASMLSVPLWIARQVDVSIAAVAAAVVIVLTLCGLALLIIPIRVARRRPVSRRSVLIPIIASGLLLAGLVLGGGFALAELLAPETRSPYWISATPSPPATGGPPAGYEPTHQITSRTILMVFVAAVLVWIAWSVVILLFLRRSDAANLGMNLHRGLIVGSVLELLVAVPSHLVVRRRTDCCAGFWTGTGICVGVAIALISFGPALVLLYYDRCRQKQNK